MGHRHVFIAAPFYTGQVHVGTMRAIWGEELLFTGRGDKFTFEDELGNGDIEIVRASLLARFLGSDATDLIFIDHDVQWESGALVKLVDHPVDFVGAVYPQRLDPINFTVRWLDYKPELWADPETGLLEVDGFPGGCMRLTRACAEKMVENYCNLAFYCAKSPNETAWHLFQKMRLPENPRYIISEDYSFCRRWRDIGGQVWIDPEVTMGHTGAKTFVGNIGEWLRNRPAEQLQQKEAA
jgi:hypothetical protein